MYAPEIDIGATDMIYERRFPMTTRGEKEYLYWLCHIKSLGDATIRKLHEYFGSFGEIWKADDKALMESGILSDKQRNALWAGKRQMDEVMKEYESLAGRGIRFVADWEEDFPHNLQNYRGMPQGLFVKGRFPDGTRPCVAIVGARECTEYGRQLTECFARELAANGVQIVSGLACGIDAAAHQGAIDAGMDTYGILGNGINICYPRENFALFERMERTGGVISEFPLDTPPIRTNFPRRNRLISGFSDAVIIIEAKERSGSLITADFALEQGKEVFAVPGRPTDPLSAGCNRLLSAGALHALSPADILEYFGVKYAKKLTVQKFSEKSLAKKEKVLYSCLDFRPRHMEELLKLSGMGLTECMESLMALELKGLAYKTGNQYYCRKM